MNNGFRKGLLIGSIIGASVSIMMNSEHENMRNKKRIVRSSRNILRKSGNIISDVVDLFR